MKVERNVFADWCGVGSGFQNLQEFIKDQGLKKENVISISVTKGFEQMAEYNLFYWVEEGEGK